MPDPVLYGAAYSVYTRIARLALLEKGIRHDVKEVDVFGLAGVPPDHLRRHPFGRIPAFTHGDFSLYEAGAIARYADEAFPGPALQPPQPAARARMTQIISLLDAYAFRPLVLDIYVQRVATQAPDEARIAAALPKAAICLAELSRFLAGNAFLAGDALSLAALHAAPMLAYFRLAAEGVALLAQTPNLQGWWDRMGSRPSVATTHFPREQA